MARANTLVSRELVKLSQTEKATIKADKLVLSVLTSGDAATLTTVRDRVNAVIATIRQEGEMAGKRFSGAADHSAESQIAAFVVTTTRGNIAKIG